MSQETNPMYADHSEQNNDLLSAPSTPISLKTSTQLPLRDFSHGLISSQNELVSHDTVVVSLKITDQQETGRELISMCFASGSVTECNSTVEVNNSSKRDVYDRTSKFTGRELVNTTCFARDSVIDSAP